MEIKTALISVFNKEGIVDFAKKLTELNFNIIASGGTAKIISAAGIAVRDVSELVGGGAILGHRVVTLSREIHAGLLARNTAEDRAELAKVGIPRIDLVCVDLYPLGHEIRKPNSTLASVIEMTDIGGPTILRSAAKGQRIVICDPANRQTVIDWLRAGEPNREEFVNGLAAKAEGIVANYVLSSARYRSNEEIDGTIGTKVLPCKYGENAWQAPAALHSTGTNDPLALDKFELVAGAAPSYNNLCDHNRLLQTITHIAAAFVRNHYGVPDIAVAVKHGNPCGAGFSGMSTQVALEKMLIGDPDAILGGMVMVNFPIHKTDAECLMSHHMKDGKRRLLDGIIAPLISEEAVETLKRKSNKCRIMTNPELGGLSAKSLDTTPIIRPVRGGFLKQPNYSYIINLIDDPDLHIYGEAEIRQKDTLLLLWAIGSTSNSNTITIGKDGYLMADAVGQQSRVMACRLAQMRAANAGHDTQGAIAYSDSFFPFDDGPRVLKEMGVKMIYTSSGSINDQQIIDYCQEHNIILYMIPDAKGRGFYGH